jgi:Transglutaminase-like superfamily
MKNIILALSALLLLGNAASAVDLGFKATTPYDRFMSPVKSVLSRIQGEQDDMRKVQSLMRTGRGFRYSFNTPYTASLPQVTAARRAGDCKDKALWLINAMNDQSARFVIGKAKRSSRISHAWVMWKHEGRWWILDCTNRRDPIPADKVGRNNYIPLYSFAKSGSFCHTPDTMFASKRGRRSPVAAQNSER